MVPLSLGVVALFVELIIASVDGEVIELRRRFHPITASSIVSSSSCGQTRGSIEVDGLLVEHKAGDKERQIQVRSCGGADLWNRRFNHGSH
jgi:hypothetical protein